MQDAFTVLTRLFTPTQGVELQGAQLLTAMIFIAAGFAHWGPNTFELRHDWTPTAAIALAGSFAVAVVLVLTSQEMPFLYLQF